LTGSLSPLTAGTYAYTPSSSLALSPGFYFVVLTAGTTVANGSYGWSYTGRYNYSENDGWQTFANDLHSNNGSTWNSVSSSDAQFAVTAEAIPESSPAWVLLLGSGLLVCLHRHDQPVRP
jgi:hypothetical protein